MNRIPVVAEDQRESYGAPTTDVDKKQKPAAPLYGKQKAPPAPKGDGKK